MTLVQLTELVDQGGEVAVPRADHERGDVVTLERHLERIDRQLDVGCVLPRRPHPLGYLDELDVSPREHPPVLVERGPVRVGLGRSRARVPQASSTGQVEGQASERSRAPMARFS